MGARRRVAIVTPSIMCCGSGGRVLGPPGGHGIFRIVTVIDHLKYKRNKLLRSRLVIRVLVGKLLLHKPDLCAHAPDKNGRQEEEKKAERPADDDCRTGARDKASVDIQRT